MILHGSALWGDRTCLRNGVPISDVDVLVIGDTLADLSAAAAALRAITDLCDVPAVPLFKLGVKFRTAHEIAREVLSANELGALRHGRVLVGRTRFDILRPNRNWFYQQSGLAVATRLVYVSEQQQEIGASSYTGVLSRYLAARLILDIATVGLLLKGSSGLSYTSRVAAFLGECRERLPAEVLPELESALLRALYTKRDPEGHECTDIPSAANLLLRYSRMLGLTAPMPSNTAEFWRNSRPLDLRDRQLWQMARRASS